MGAPPPPTWRSEDVSYELKEGWVIKSIIMVGTPTTRYYKKTIGDNAQHRECAKLRKREQIEYVKLMCEL